MYPHLIYLLALGGLAQYELAGRLRISEARLSRVLAGRLQFTPTERERLLDLFPGIDPAWIFERPTPRRLDSLVDVARPPRVFA